MNQPKPVRRAHRRTKDERVALEHQVLSATLELFAEGGHEAVSIRRLAAKVGVAPMSLYRYFPSKSHLMHDLWQDILERACAQGRAEMARAGGHRPRLCAFVAGFVRYWLESREQYHVVFALSPPHDPDAGEWPRPDLHPVRLLLSELAAACSPDGTLHEHVERLVDELAWMILGFLHVVVGLGNLTLHEALDQAQCLQTSVDEHVRSAFEPLGALRAPAAPHRIG